MRAIQTLPPGYFSAATLPTLTKGFHTSEGIPKVEFISVVASNAESAGVYIYTNPEIEIVFFLALWLAG